MIPYRKDLNRITGSVTASIFLQQVLFRWEGNGEKEFYKFKEPCDNELYRDGDSWCEELGFSRKEFDTARDVVASKFSASTEKDPNAIVWYRTDSSRTTYYSINEELLEFLIDKMLSQESCFTKSPLYVKSESYFTKSPNRSLVQYSTENTTKNLRPNPDFPSTLKEKKAGQGVQPLNNEDDADSVENTLSDDIKRAISRTDLKARIKHVLDAKWNKDLPKLYGRSKQNLAADALDAMMSSGFVGNDNTAIGNWIRKFVTNRSKTSEQKSFPPEVTAIVEDLIKRTLNVGPYNKLMQPLRDFEKTKMAEWVESKPEIHHWHAFDTLIDLFSRLGGNPEYLTVSNALGKYAEENKDFLAEEYNKRLKRVGLK